MTLLIRFINFLIYTIRIALFVIFQLQKNLLYIHITYNKNELSKMKDGVGIINAARGGVIDETELINYIENEKVSFAGLDTFENEPTPSVKLLMHPKISLSPHIGAATSEAQDRIGIELADQIINYFNNDK